MAESTTDNRTEATETDADALASAVDALIDEIEGVCEAFDKSRADDAPAAPEADAPHAKAPARAAEAPADESLDAAVDALVAESVGAEAETPPAASDADEPEDAVEERAEPAASGSIDDLDAELAAAADEELAGDFATMDDLDGEAVSPESLTPKPEPAPEPAPEPEPVAARAPVAPAPKAAPEPAPAVVEETAAPAPKPARRSWVAPALRVLASPLSRLTPMQRDTLGWVALNTLFLAACVWVFVLLR